MTTLPDHPLARIIPADDVAAWVDGYAFVARAHAEAALIRASAQAEVAAAAEVARQDGLHAARAEATQLLVQTQSAVAAYLQGIEGELAALALTIVQEVLGDLDAADAIGMATRQALRTARGKAAQMTLSVSPQMVDAVARVLDDVTDLQIVPDRHLGSDQAILTTPASSIDISLDRQLDIIAQAMTRPHPTAIP